MSLLVWGLLAREKTLKESTKIGAPLGVVHIKTKKKQLKELVGFLPEVPYKKNVSLLQGKHPLPLVMNLSPQHMVGP